MATRYHTTDGNTGRELEDCTEIVTELEDRRMKTHRLWQLAIDRELRLWNAGIPRAWQDFTDTLTAKAETRFNEAWQAARSFMDDNDVYMHSWSYPAGANEVVEYYGRA